MLICIYCICMVGKPYNTELLSTLSQLSVQGSHSGSLKLTMIEIFFSQISADYKSRLNLLVCSLSRLKKAMDNVLIMQIQLKTVK